MKVKQHKKWLVLLVFCMTMFAVPFTVHAAAGEILVNGVNIVTAANNKVNCGSGTAVYDANAGTLTLKNATISDEENGSGTIHIPSGTPLKLLLEGANKITSAGNSELLFSESDLTISGEGTLTIEGTGTGYGIIIPQSDLNIDGTEVTVKMENGYAIMAEYNINIKDSTVISSGKNQGIETIASMTISHSKVMADISDSSSALSAQHELTIENLSSVIVNGEYTINCGRKIEISDSSVHAAASNYYAIVTNALTITGNSEVTATTAGGGALSAGNPATFTPTTGKMVEILAGADKESAESLAGSPFTGQVDLTTLKLDSYSYFHGKTVDSAVSPGGGQNCHYHSNGCHLSSNLHGDNPN